MNKRISRFFWATAICLALMPAPALAFGHGHRDGDHDRDDHKVRDRDRDHDRDRDRDKDRDRDGDKDRDHRREVRGHNFRDHDGDRDDHPGWNKGKKKGWGNCDLPPGQAKKHGCDSDDRGVRHRRHDGDHDRDDVRRASVHHPAPVVRPAARPVTHSVSTRANTTIARHRATPDPRWSLRKSNTQGTSRRLEEVK